MYLHLCFLNQLNMSCHQPGKNSSLQVLCEFCSPCGPGLKQEQRPEEGPGDLGLPPLTLRVLMKVDVHFSVAECQHEEPSQDFQLGQAALGST